MKLSMVNIKNYALNILRDGEFNITGLVTKEYDAGEDVLTYTESVKYAESLLANKNATAVVCTEAVYDTIKDDFVGGICVSEKPRSTFFMIHNFLAKEKLKFEESVISKSAKIHPTAIIDEKGVVIGDNTVIGPYTIINSNSIIGNNVVIGERCVTGAPGFYYYDGKYGKELVASTGKTVIEDNVNLHVGVVVCNGVFWKDTCISKNAKLDSNVFIAHDVYVGENTLIASGSTLAGYTIVGDNSFLGVGVNTVPMVKIGAETLLSAGSVVTKEVPENKHFSGNFAIEHSKFIVDLKDKF